MKLHSTSLFLTSNIIHSIWLEAIKVNKKLISAKNKQLASRDNNTRNEDLPNDSNDVHDAIFARIQQQSR